MRDKSRKSTSCAPLALASASFPVHSMVNTSEPSLSGRRWMRSLSGLEKNLSAVSRQPKGRCHDSTSTPTQEVRSAQMARMCSLSAMPILTCGPLDARNNRPPAVVRLNAHSLGRTRPPTMALAATLAAARDKLASRRSELVWYALISTVSSSPRHEAYNSSSGRLRPPMGSSQNTPSVTPQCLS